jgi:hypothetical protein
MGIRRCGLGRHPFDTVQFVFSIRIISLSPLVPLSLVGIQYGSLVDESGRWGPFVRVVLY